MSSSHTTPAGPALTTGVVVSIVTLLSGGGGGDEEGSSEEAGFYLAPSGSGATVGWSTRW